MLSIYFLFIFSSFTFSQSNIFYLYSDYHIDLNYSYVSFLEDSPENVLRFERYEFKYSNEFFGHILFLNSILDCKKVKYILFSTPSNESSLLVEVDNFTIKNVERI